MPRPLDAPGRWIADRRGEGRAVRVSAHTEAGFLVLSTWKQGVCVGTVRLVPGEAAELIAGVSEALAHLAQPVVADPAEKRLGGWRAGVEARLARLERRDDPPLG